MPVERAASANGRDGRGGAADRAHASIRAAIMRGELAPATMLSENDLAASLGMSRTPVRAALGRLQDEGWVTIYPQRGALVRELSNEEVRECADVRNALESAGIMRSSTDRRGRLADELSGNVDRQARALKDGDFAGFATLALEFHRTFVVMSGNRTMLEVYDRLQDRQYLSILRSADRISGDPLQVLGEHRVLLEDARRGDWAGFATHLGDHQTRSHGLETGLRQR